MPKGCKAIFEVRAGVIPGNALAEYTKRWSYDSDDYELDRRRKPGELTIHATRLQEAHQYAAEISDPSRLNWVHVDWLWM